MRSLLFFFFFSSRRRHTRLQGDWSSDVCSSDLPWKLFEWWFFFDAYAPRVFDTGGAIAGGSGLLAVVVAIGMSIWRSRQSRLVTTYGSARRANAGDIRQAGLTPPARAVLRPHHRPYLRHEGPGH